MAAAALVAMTFAAGRLPAQRTVATWPVAARPAVVIGGASGGPHTEFAGITSAHRFRDGGIVVANSDPAELRLFDAHGQYLRTIGRAGNGPGEFQGLTMVVDAGGDSVLAYSSGNDRWEYFDRAGHLRREWKGSTTVAPTDLLLYQHLFATRRRGVPFACVRALADHLPDRGRGALGEVVPGARGSFWVSRLGMPVWLVYSQTGSTLARVSLPPHTRLLEVDADAAVVMARDADDIERVEVWPVTMPAAAPAPRAPCLQVPDSVDRSPHGIAPARLKTELRNLQAAAAHYDATHQRYPSTLPDFGMPLAHDLVPLILFSGRTGWSGAMADPKNRVYCITSVGTSELPGWPSGAVACAPIVPGGVAP